MDDVKEKLVSCPYEKERKGSNGTRRAVCQRREREFWNYSKVSHERTNRKRFGRAWERLNDCP